MAKAGDPLPAGLAPRISEVVSGRVPGLALAVVDPDGIRWAGAIGDADISSGRSASPRMVCNWYSMTKIVTATAVLRLVERGALRLDDPAARYLPAFARLRPPQRAEQITIRHLLSHSGGLANPIPIRWVHPADKRGPDPERFLEDLLAKNPKVRFEPGIRASYTNIGYLALGQLVAAVAGMSYEAYVSDHTERAHGPPRYTHSSSGSPARKLCAVTPASILQLGGSARASQEQDLSRKVTLYRQLPGPP